MMRRILKQLLPYGLVNSYERAKNPLRYNLIEEPIDYYSDNGERRFFYLQERSSEMNLSYTAGQIPKHIYWDRSNYSLPIHFYLHDQIFDSKPICQKKFGIILEPEAYLPSLYKRIIDSPETISGFDAIFTHSERILEKYSNAKLYYGQGVWIGTPQGKGTLDEFACDKKKKMVSMVSSDKAIIEGHRIRKYIANELKKDGFVDTFGAFDGGRTIYMSEALTDYRFSVILENESSPYYFTEKVLNCFATMTIPIYCGASKIGDFFNTDGMILFDKNDSIENIKKLIKAECSIENYSSRINAIRENYYKVLKYVCWEDMLYDNYKDLF